jgi:hypothetical protein
MQSNELLKRFNSKYGVNFAPRKLSWFYWESVQSLWRPGRPISSSTPISETEETPLELSTDLSPFTSSKSQRKRTLDKLSIILGD